MADAPAVELTPKPFNARPSEIFQKYDTYPDGKVKAEMFSSYEEMLEKTVLIPSTPLQGATVGQIWSTAFASASDFFQTYHERRGDTNLVIPQWDITADRSHGSRMYNCIANIDGTLSPFFEAARIAMCKDPDSNCNKLVVQLSAQTPEVIMGTTFRVEAMLVFVEAADNVVNVTITGACKKMASRFSLIRGIADSRACSDMKKAYKAFLEQLSEALHIAKAEVKEVVPTPVALSPPRTVERREEVKLQSFDMKWIALGCLGFALIISLLMVILPSSSPSGPFNENYDRSTGMDSELMMLLGALDIEVPQQYRSTSTNTNVAPSAQGLPSGSSSGGGTGDGSVLSYRVAQLEQKVQSLESTVNVLLFSLWSVSLIVVISVVVFKCR